MLFPSKKTVEPAGSQAAFLDMKHRVQTGEIDGVTGFSSLLELHPESLETLGALQWALACRGRHKESIEICHRYLDLQPENVEIRWRMGDRCLNLGKFEDAVLAYHDALSKDPSCEDAVTGIEYVEYLKRMRGTVPGAQGTAEYKQLTETQNRNLKLNTEEFRLGKSRLLSLPANLYLESTTKCNFYCQTCSKGASPYYAEDLHQDVLSRIEHEIMPTNVRISITGFGEPTMAEGFDRIFSMACSNGSETHFVTNGSLLNFARIEQLVRNPCGVSISMDGASQETFEAIRAGSRFESIRKRLSMIKKLRDVHLSGQRSSFAFTVVALRKNIRELPDIVRLAHRYGMDSVNVADYSLGGREFDEQSLRFTPDLANRSMEEARKVAAELGVPLYLPPPYNSEPPLQLGATLWQRVRNSKRLLSESGRLAQRCYSPWMEPYIHTDGVVTPCCANNLYLGDLKVSSFQEIWNGWRYRRLRLAVHSPLPPPDCRNCNVYWGINAGNPGNAMAKEGLLVKLCYFLLYRLRKFKEVIGRIAFRVFRKQGAFVVKTPNFERGRPIKSERKYTRSN
jgi:MoaA/NifB/PqqE/SkfB family radical SAM enzyme